VALGTAASKIHVGFGYSWRYRGLKLPYGSQTGPGVGAAKSLPEFTFVLLDACDFQYGSEQSETGETLFYDTAFDTGITAGQPVPLFTGEVRYQNNSGYDSDPRLVMKGDVPLPWTLLGIAPKVVTNEK
jgi:hypothetical protein